jgi:hypothetical protein
VGIAERERALAPPEPEPEIELLPVAVAPEPEPEPSPVYVAPPAGLEPVAAAFPVLSSAGGYVLDTLERLVSDRGSAYPELRDEWAFTLLYLRDYAAASGHIPPQFDTMIEEVFGPLLGG